MQAGGVVRELDRLARRCKQGKIRRRTFEDAVELIGGDLRIAPHVGKLGVDLAGEDEIRATLAPRREQIDGQVGIAAQAEALAGGVLRLDQLCNDIDAEAEDQRQSVCVIRRDIVLLRIGYMQPLPGEEEELVDLYVARQRPGADRRGVAQGGIALEQPLGERSDKATFEVLLGSRRLERQGGEDMQVNRGVCGCAGKQRIGDVVGFAQP